MNYIEFQEYEEIKDSANPFSTLLKGKNEETFYIEPIFYTYLQSFKTQYSDHYEMVVNKIKELASKYHKVIFTGMDEETESEPITKAEGYIILTIFDIANMCGILMEDKSRGSDYGD